MERRISNRATAIILTLTVIILGTIIVSIAMNLPKVKAKNEKIDNKIADEIDFIVYGNDLLNTEETEQTNIETNENALNEQQKQNDVNQEVTNIEETNLVNEKNTRQDYVM